MNCPPTKRLRGLDQDVATMIPFDDPFGDDEDFTQDDLDEIDIIASQAITSASSSRFGSKPGGTLTESACGSSWQSSARQSESVSRATVNQSREKTFGFSISNRGNAGISSREPLGNEQQWFVSDKEDSYSLLEAQHADLKRKLKEVEEEIVMKSGEIQVLRDSLKGAQQEKEAQRKNQILLETQRQKEQSDREKELNKKVQSLQSELQFKEAEINEMKTKLHNSDKHKTNSPLPRNSLKVLSNLAQVNQGSGSSSSSTIVNGFITKEMFGAHTSSRMTPVKTPPKTRRDGGDRGSSSSRSGDRQEVTCTDPFLSVRPAHVQHQGGVLLGLLLQQPLSPISLGLCHLLSMNLTDIKLKSSRLSADFLLHSDTVVGLRAALSPVQSLAVTGLNLMSQSRAESADCSRYKRACPGAVLLLPLLDLHLSQLRHALDTLRSTAANSGGSNTSAANSLPADQGDTPSATGRLQEHGLTDFSMEDAGLAALRLLYLLLAHSDEVVDAVLSKGSQTGVTNKKAQLSAAGMGLSSENALLQSVLWICKAGLRDSSSSQKELVLNAMKTLRVLIERTPETHTDRLQCMLPVLCVCLSSDSRLETVSECVFVVMSMSDHQTMAQQLCSYHDPCVLLKLFQFIRTRSDNKATHTDWILLDLQVVRLLKRLMTQRVESWTTNHHSTCQCYTELVQAVVIIFHRQWLDLRGTYNSSHLALPLHQCPTLALPWWHSTAASLLRECLLLLHWLLLHHGSFSESCRPLLHMYDQVIPAVRETLRKIPGLSESEELALEEVCRSEGDDIDDIDTDTGS